MQIVINIPKYVYDTIIACDGYVSDCDNEKVGMAVKNGTPLPKGHGRLIDANSIYQIVRPIEETDDGWGVTGETAKRLMHEAFNRAPTIIEADNGESE